jgi:hypothetical protein
VEASLEAFKELVRKEGAKSKLSPPSKFIKKLDEIPSLELSPEDPCNCALFLAERTHWKVYGVMAQFFGVQ